MMSDSRAEHETSDRWSRHIDKGAEHFKESTSSSIRQTRASQDTAAENLDSGMHQGTGRFADGAKRAAQHAESATDCSRQEFDDAPACVDDWLDKLRSQVREKPAQSIVIALAAGWLIGNVLQRR